MVMFRDTTFGLAFGQVFSVRWRGKYGARSGKEPLAVRSVER